MKRKIVLAVTICICFLLQSTVFQSLSFAGIAPNLLIIVISSFGFMRGSKEGMFVGFFCGVLVDIFFGFYLGIYALLYMYVGYLNGFFTKHFYPDDIKLPMFMIGASDFVCNIVIYLFMFIFRQRFHFGYYLKSIIIPELIYTMVISIILYFILLMINQKLGASEKRSAKKFEF